LRTVKSQAGATKAEYRYNGLNQRIAWHYDVDADNDVDSNDNWFYFTHDEKWRIVATHRGNGGGTTVETDPKERFIYHLAGLGGYGGSSYIDSVILRDRDNTSGWNSSSDGTLEERRYYIQNWRADVVALLSDTGAMVERIKYSAYGIPFNLPMGDNDCNGICNSTDVGQINTWILAGTWSALGDTDLDGDVDATDATNAGNNLISTGRTLLSYSSIGNRIGWAGYQAAPELLGNKWHVRNRFFNTDIGRWNTRDPIGYVDGVSLYEYVRSQPNVLTDPYGLEACSTSRWDRLRDFTLDQGEYGDDIRGQGGAPGSGSGEGDPCIRGGCGGCDPLRCSSLRISTCTAAVTINWSTGSCPPLLPRVQRNYCCFEHYNEQSRCRGMRSGSRQREPEADGSGRAAQLRERGTR